MALRAEWAARIITYFGMYNWNLLFPSAICGSWCVMWHSSGFGGMIWLLTAGRWYPRLSLWWGFSVWCRWLPLLSSCVSSVLGVTLGHWVSCDPTVVSCSCIYVGLSMFVCSLNLWLSGAFVMDIDVVTGHVVW